jgi:hypothetical protein
MRQSDEAAGPVGNGAGGGRSGKSASAGLALMCMLLVFQFGEVEWLTPGVRVPPPRTTHGMHNNVHSKPSLDAVISTTGAGARIHQLKDSSGNSNSNSNRVMPTDTGGTRNGAANVGNIGPYGADNAARCATAEYRHGMRRKLKGKKGELVYAAVTAGIVSSADAIESRRGHVHLDCRGQWGNHLGQYAVARVVAEELNFGLTVCPTLLDANWKKGHIFPGLGEIPFEKENSKGLEQIEFGKHSYHVKELLQNTTPRILHMWGYPFDDFWPFGEYRSRIREIFKLDVACTYWNQTYPKPEDVVVHIRSYSLADCHSGKEIVQSNGDRPNFDPTEAFSDPPYEYYRAILSQMQETKGWGTLWLASRCGLNDQVANRIAKEFGGVLTPAAEIHADMADFLFMTASKRLIMSQSTFAWWAAFLGGGETEVHYPLVGEWWGKRPRHRLYPDESRYHFHDLYSSPFRTFLSRDQIQEQVDAQKPAW